MDSHVEPRLRLRRVPQAFNLPLELARSHGLLEDGDLVCADMMYAEGYGMVPCRTPYTEPVSTPTERVLLFAEDILRRFLEAISHDPPQTIAVTIIRKRRGTEHWYNSQTHILESRAKTSVVVYTAPNRNHKILCQFARLMKLISDIMIAVQSRTIVTKRELFYGDPALFETQNVVNRMLEDIAFTCRVQLEDLFVTAEERSLMAGPRNTPFLEGQYLRSGPVKWLLVVEKETVFQHLRQRAFSEQSAQGFGIILTGKGYPDRAAHLHLQKILESLLAPVFGLFDCDPDGFQIAKTYMFPTTFHPHCPQMIRLIEPVQYMIDVAANGNESSLIPLTTTRKRKTQQGETHNEDEGPSFGGDRKKIRDILVSLQHDQSVTVRDIQRDLQRLQMIGQKGEIEALDDGAGGLMRWLDAKMDSQMTKGYLLNNTRIT